MIDGFRITLFTGVFPCSHPLNPRICSPIIFLLVSAHVCICGEISVFLCLRSFADMSQHVQCVCAGIEALEYAQQHVSKHLETLTPQLGETCLLTMRSQGLLLFSCCVCSHVSLPAHGVSCPTLLSCRNWKFQKKKITVWLSPSAPLRRSGQETTRWCRRRRVESNSDQHPRKGGHSFLPDPYVMHEDDAFDS
mgnify:CR=1 FL=1